MPHLEVGPQFLAASSGESAGCEAADAAACATETVVAVRSTMVSCKERGRFAMESSPETVEAGVPNAASLERTRSRKDCSFSFAAPWMLGIGLFSDQRRFTMAIQRSNPKDVLCFTRRLSTNASLGDA